MKCKSLKAIAAREGIDNSYVSRVVNLTTLSPDIVAAILDDDVAESRDVVRPGGRSTGVVGGTEAAA